MKKLLLAAVAALAFANPAQADDLHPNFIGKWCETTAGNMTHYFFTPDGDDCNSGSEQLLISRQRISGFEWQCGIRSVRNTKQRSEGVPVTIIRARCDEAGSKSWSPTIKLTYGKRARLTFEMSK